MSAKNRSVSILLVAIGVATIAYASIFIAQPMVLTRLFADIELDSFHMHLARMAGSLLALFGVGACIASVNPRKYTGLIIILILMFLSIFVLDIITIARGQVSFQTLLPEMGFALAGALALVRFFPSREEEVVIEQPAELSEKDRDDLTGTPPPPSDQSPSSDTTT